jgi:Asp-tRNA(Asn)/Glu-tRNA(Gln) amidotransferase A subunit family amidase
MENETNPEAEAPEVEDVQDDLDVEYDGDAEEAEPEDDTEEVDLDGVKHRIPKALKGAFLMQADYTRKTQEIAEQRRELGERLAQQSQVSEQIVQAKARVVMVEQQLADYETIDWDGWEERVSAFRAAGQYDQAQEDALALQSALRKHQALKEARAEAGQYVQSAQQEASLVAARESARQAQESMAYLEQHNIALTPDLAGKLITFGTQYGYSPQELNQITDARFIVAMHRLMELEKGAKTNKAVQQGLKAQSVQPAQKVRGANSAPSGRLDDRASVDAWMKARQAQAARKRG